MYDIMAPGNNVRVRITRNGDSVKIRTPYMPNTREFLRHYVVGAEWDSFEGVWTGIVPEDQQMRLGRILKQRFMSPVLLEDEKPMPTSPTHKVEASLDTRWSVLL